MDMEKYKIKDLNKWIPWFVGFSDAEGSFQVYHKKRILKSGELSKVNVGCFYHLSLHKKDLCIIKDIQCALNNTESIYEYKDKLDSRLAINNKNGLFYIMDNVFDVWPLLTKHQLARYTLLKKSLLNNVKEFPNIDMYDGFVRNTMNEIDTELIPKFNSNRTNDLLKIAGIDSWIVGFINGEGSFPFKDRPIFTIEHTDFYALDIINKRLCFGPKIRARSPRERDVNKIIKPTFILEISSKNDIKTLIEFLDSNHTADLQGNKNIQYNKWKDRK